ncbi:MAG: aldose 1-epimerase family protein [Cyclobacteriaceae bacterium]
MNYILENEIWSIQVKEAGAELCSVQNKNSGREYMHDADPKTWPRHAPVLFPIVGRLKNDTYRAEGNTYHMKQHGFARDKDFHALEQEVDRLEFGLTADDETMQQYPYNFVLDIIYTLQENELRIEYIVSNKDQRDMPFSIGAHPAFATPRIIDKQMQEYHLVFEKPETLDRHFVEDGLRNGESKRLLENEHKLPLHPIFFERDAIIFKGVQSEKVSLVEQNSGKMLVEVNIKGFPYLGIWQKMGADFICIEPWYGVSDSADFQGDIFEKEGIMVLAAGEKFSCSYSIRFF